MTRAGKSTDTNCLLHFESHDTLMFVSMLLIYNFVFYFKFKANSEDDNRITSEIFDEKPSVYCMCLGVCMFVFFCLFCFFVACICCVVFQMYPVSPLLLTWSCLAGHCRKRHQGLWTVRVPGKTKAIHIKGQIGINIKICIACLKLEIFLFFFKYCTDNCC